MSVAEFLAGLGTARVVLKADRFTVRGDASAIVRNGIGLLEYTVLSTEINSSGVVIAKIRRNNDG